MKINILLVDDDRMILGSLKNRFCSDIFSISIADSIYKANQIIATASEPWHCWVLDIDLGEGATGFDIVDAHPGFPFVLLLSGLSPQQIKAEFGDKTHLRITDKSFSAFNSLCAEICKSAALGYILNGQKPDSFPVFSLLLETAFKSEELWAFSARLSPVYLDALCKAQTGKSALEVITIFNELYGTLIKNMPGE